MKKSSYILLFIMALVFVSLAADNVAMRLPIGYYHDTPDYDFSSSESGSVTL